MNAFLDFAQAALNGEAWAVKVIAITSLSMIGLIAGSDSIISITRSIKVKK